MTRSIHLHNKNDILLAHLRAGWYLCYLQMCFHTWYVAACFIRQSHTSLHPAHNTTVRTTSNMSDVISSKNKSSATTIAPVTRNQIKDAKGQGDICGWSGLPAKLPRGRPKKHQLNQDRDTDDGQRAKRSAELALDAPSALPKKKQRGLYDKWMSDENMFAQFKAAVISESTGSNECQDYMFSARIPRTTVRCHKAAFKDAAKLHSILLSDVTCVMVFPKGCGVPAQLSTDECRFVSDVAISRDLWNNGMTRSEIITMVMELLQWALRSQAKNHYD